EMLLGNIEIDFSATEHGIHYVQQFFPDAEARRDRVQIAGTAPQMNLAADFFAEILDQISLAGKEPMAAFAAHTFPAVRLHLPERFQDRNAVIARDQLLLGQHHDMRLIERVRSEEHTS